MSGPQMRRHSGGGLSRDPGKDVAAPPIIVASMPGHPDIRLVAAACRAGALGILDLTENGPRDLLLDELGRAASQFGVRLRDAHDLDPESVPDECECVILPHGANAHVWTGRRILIEVGSAAEAEQAAKHNPHGLIARGFECGGRFGEETAFILLQRLRRTANLPLWLQGGIGLHTAPAAIAGGASGVVLDSQLSLVSESTLPADIAEALRRTDGTNTRVEEKVRFLPVANDPERRILAGQDAMFSRRFAERFRTAGGVIRAVRDSMNSHLRAAKTANPLAPHSGLAVSHGTQFPIVQGPMTRVSDGVEFAEAVAASGALPMLALALLRGEPLQRLLQQTKERMVRTSWGVGILGFVPSELREEQIQAVLQVRPGFAVIAGGRPSQALQLEEAGIATYLHAPTPGLLEIFLQQGARRFVFEGSECGGHIGPYTSFGLWEAQLQRLQAFERPEELSILFAGGIHDANSAAMVAAMTAPLAARGASVGVQIGTAYLFTREAVASGAIVPEFQKVAQECEETALLETAPGHSTRCANTRHVGTFQEESQRLDQIGIEARDKWAQLEQFNLGRLRVAAKGLMREKGSIVAVKPEFQRRQGLFMMGQAAALRRAEISMSELHREISEGSSEILGQIVLPPTGEVPRQPADVAIIGMACLFPGAPDVQAFWKNTVRGISSITEVSPERWDPELYYDPEGHPGETTPSKWGGFLDDLLFDPLSHGIPPRSLSAIEPLQLLSLEVARQALQDAGYEGREFDRERTSVIFGADGGTGLAGAYGFRALFPQMVGPLPKELDERLPSPTEDSFPGVLANVIAGRIANRLDFGGVNYTVDAACASSLAAVDLACKELAAGTSDMVVCGGADLHNSIQDYLMFASVRALSPHGRCGTFDDEADGITLGEGVAVVVLKRLRDAVEDGDRIYAVIRGIGGSSDGKSLGLTAPNRHGQARALRRAYACAGVEPASVGLMEAHGTGTVVGDATEMEALTDVFQSAGAIPSSCALGSAKALIGHTKCAAGMAGLIKAALAVYHGVLPPANHIRKPNATYKEEDSPFRFLEQAAPWTAEKRLAGVSAFGFGGSNFHAVIDQPPESSELDKALIEWPAELFLFRAANRSALEAQVSQVQSCLQAAGGRLRMRDLAWSTWCAGEGPVQAAVVARNPTELAEALTDVRSGVPKPGSVYLRSPKDGKLALLFPGQGSQRCGMFAGLFTTFKDVRPLLGLVTDIQRVMYPPAAYTFEGRERREAALTETRVAQPALGVCDLAMSRLLARCNVSPDMLAGHSYGELVALCVAGVFTEEQLIALSRSRAECIHDAAGSEPGAMAAVTGDLEEVARTLSGMEGIWIANQNSPRQSVIAGSSDAVNGAVSDLEERGVSVRILPVSCAFHSPLLTNAKTAFASVLKAVEVGRPAVPVWSNVTAGPYVEDAAAVRELLSRQVVSPALFRQQIESMYEAGARVFVESGPGAVLTGLVNETLQGRDFAAIPMNRRSGDDLSDFLAGLAQIAAAGIDVDPTWLFEGRQVERVDLQDAAKLAPSAGCWRVNGYRAEPLHGELPAYAMRHGRSRVPLTSAEPSGGREAVLREFLRNMREMAEAQRDAVLHYLAAAPESDHPEVRAAAEMESAAALPDAQTVETPEIGDAESELLLAVSNRTGYPVDMLDLDLDLEADLSIDSLKRLEIISHVADRLGVGSGDRTDQERVMEQLVRSRTLREVVSLLNGPIEDARTAVAHGIPPAPASVEPAAGPLEPSPPDRFVISMERVPAAVPCQEVLDGSSFAVLGESGSLAELIAEKLQSRGGMRLEQGNEAEASAIVYLAGISPATANNPLRDLFSFVQSVDAARELRLLVCAATTHGQHGFGGFIRSIAKERPRWTARFIELDAQSTAAEQADIAWRELLSSDGPPEVAYSGLSRRTPRLVLAATNGAGPGLDLGSESVVLVTGGARGITAAITAQLARRFGCRLIVVGKSAMSKEEESPELAGLAEAASIRRFLVSRNGYRDPSAVETEMKRILAVREIRQTLNLIQEAGSLVEYHPLDVCDSRALAELIGDVYSRHKRIDGVIHGAGVIEDKLINDKTWDSFARVCGTKLSAAQTLAGALRDDVRFVVFFSSVAGELGNRGQADYAAASQALNRLAAELNNRFSGRVVSISWGPWRGAGMVTRELENEFLRRGVRLIDLNDGVEAFFQELNAGNPADAQVVWSACGEESFP